VQQFKLALELAHRRASGDPPDRRLYIKAPTTVGAFSCGDYQRSQPGDESGQDQGSTPLHAPLLGDFGDASRRPVGAIISKRRRYSRPASPLWCDAWLPVCRSAKVSLSPLEDLPILLSCPWHCAHVRAHRLIPVPSQRWHRTTLSPFLSVPLPSQFLHFCFFLPSLFCIGSSGSNGRAWRKGRAKREA